MRLTYNVFVAMTITRVYERILYMKELKRINGNEFLKNIFITILQI